MVFDNETRKLTSETGYLRRIEDGVVFDHPIYIGKYDAPTDYEEIIESEYEEKQNETESN